MERSALNVIATKTKLIAHLGGPNEIERLRQAVLELLSRYPSATPSWVDVRRYIEQLDEAELDALVDDLDRLDEPLDKRTLKNIGPRTHAGTLDKICRYRKVERGNDEWTNLHRAFVLLGGDGPELQALDFLIRALDAEEIKIADQLRDLRWSGTGPVTAAKLRKRRMREKNEEPYQAPDTEMPDFRRAVAAVAGASTTTPSPGAGHAPDRSSKGSKPGGDESDQAESQRGLDARCRTRKRRPGPSIR